MTRSQMIETVARKTGFTEDVYKRQALRMVWQAVGAVNIPVVGLGGIATGLSLIHI